MARPFKLTEVEPREEREGLVTLILYYNESIIKLCNTLYIFVYIVWCGHTWDFHIHSKKNKLY